MLESLFTEGTLVLSLMIFAAGFILELLAALIFSLPRDQHRALHAGLFCLGILLAGLIGHSLFIGAALGLLVPLFLLRQRLWCLFVYALAGHVYLIYSFCTYIGTTTENEQAGLVIMGLLALLAGLWSLLKIDSRGSLSISRALFVQLRSVILGALLGVMFATRIDSLWLWAAFGAALQLNLLSVGILSLLQTGRA